MQLDSYQDFPSTSQMSSPLDYLYDALIVREHACS
jgi:hypothetical protein